jgi:hypothetical protein
MKTFIAVVVLLVGSVGWAQTTRPTTRPSGSPPAVDEMFRQLLVPARPTARPLEPSPNMPKTDITSGKAVAPNAPRVNLIREGTIIFDRRGRLNRAPDGQYEFHFESDGQAMKDPPMVILPNQQLMAMENAIKTNSRELRFSITGMVTEYNGRNYVLLDKAVVARSNE